MTFFENRGGIVPVMQGGGADDKIDGVIFIREVGGIGDDKLNILNVLCLSFCITDHLHAGIDAEDLRGGHCLCEFHC